MARTIRRPPRLRLAAALALGLAAGLTGGVRAAEVRLVDLSDAIGPASADFVLRALDDAAADGAELVVIRLDTPGGLDLAMRDIIRGILASPVPVATWVAPGGARAASAGTYILYASHFAAMAPATNVGSSTPVSIGAPVPSPPDGREGEDGAGRSGGAMERKVINDAVAYIKGLAELRGRNAEWAELTVTEAANLTASEALELNVIDLMAGDIGELLARLDGRAVAAADRELALDLGDSLVVEVEPDWRHEFLSLITNPNVAYILLMIGIYGLVLEFYNPGIGLPGIVGVICLLIGAYALQMLPISYAGLALIVVGAGLMTLEAFSPSFGVFGLGGLAAFVLGSVILMDTDLDAFRISLSIIIAAAAGAAALFIFALAMLLRSRRREVVSGAEAMVGATAVALESFTGPGSVRVFSESWKAHSDRAVEKGDAVEVIGVDGLTLKVEKRERKP